MSETSATSGPIRLQRTSLQQALGVLRHRWWIMTMAIVIVLAVSLVRSLTEHKQYTATAAILFQNTNLDQAFFGSPAIEPDTNSQEEATTNTELVSLIAIAELAAPVLSQDGIHIDSTNVHGAVSVQQAGQSDLVDVVATMRSPNQAAQVANVYANSYVTFARNSDQTKVQQAVQLVQSQLAQLSPKSARAGELSRDVSQLEVLKALQTGNAEVAQTATPPIGPSAPRTKRSAAIAVLLGGLLGIALILLVERLDRRIRDVDEIQEIFQKPILAAVAVSPALASSWPVNKDRTSSLEPFRMLRANLAYFRIGGERRSLIVTSGATGEGKTTVALNLAIAGALAGQRVLLLEADLRRPSIARSLRITDEPRGLAEVLSGQAEFADVVVSHTLPEITHGTGDLRIDVLLAGAVPPNPAELVESDDMAHLLGQLEQSYNLIVVDTPPVTIVSDALLLLNRGQGVVIVVRLNKTTRDTAARLREQLATIGVDPLGVVVNAIQTRRGGYYYYGYGDDSGRSRDSKPVQPPVESQLGDAPESLPIATGPD